LLFLKILNPWSSVASASSACHFERPQGFEPLLNHFEHPQGFERRRLLIRVHLPNLRHLCAILNTLRAVNARSALNHR
jgi:hypothetical protein